ncbi:Serine/threonine-protein phosphatase 2A 65 kDa regulatory subunit A gamma isoform (AtA gamma) (PP2A, partial [Durusdinium trenchii]
AAVSRMESGEDGGKGGGGMDVLEFWREEVSDFLSSQIRAHAARHAHLVAREVGSEAVVQVVVDVVLSNEIEDVVWGALATSLGEKEFAGSRKAKSILHWLLENPSKRVRTTAVRSVLSHAHRGEALVQYPGCINMRELEWGSLPDGSDDSADIKMGGPGSSGSTNEGGDNSGEQGGEGRGGGGGSNDRWLLPSLCDPNAFVSYFQRISVCEILGTSVPTGLDAQQEEDLIARLGKDPVPMVRVAVAENLGNLKRRAVIKDLMGDPDDLVQAKSIENCVGQFMQAMRTDEDRGHFLNFLREHLVHSPSWRARFALAKQMWELFDGAASFHGSGATPHSSSSSMAVSSPSNFSMDVDTASDAVSDAKRQDAVMVLREILVDLFSDPEPEVRSAAARHFGYFKDDRRYLPILNALVSDEDEDARRAAISCFPQVAKVLPLEVAELVMELLSRDPDPEVYTFAVRTLFESDLLMSFTDHHSLAIVQTLYSKLRWHREQSMQAYSWRTKDEVVRATATIIRRIPAEPWQSRAAGLDFVLNCLKDPVYTVRANTCKQVAALAQTYGSDWVNAHLAGVPAQLYDAEGADYKVRITALELAHELFRIQCFHDQALIQRARTHDPVANVREKADLLFPSSAT